MEESADEDGGGQGVQYKIMAITMERFVNTI